MKEQVNKAYEEGNSEDEKTESLSEVRRVLPYHFVPCFSRKTKMAQLLL